MRRWCPWALGALIAVAVALYLWDRGQDAELRAEIDRAKQATAEAVERADSVEARADSIGDRADSLERRLRGVRARERRRRDSLEREAAEASERLAEAREGVARGDSLENAAFDELDRAVRPELRPVVREAVRGDSIEDASRDSAEAALEAEALFERQMRESVELELAATQDELAERRTEVDTLRAALEQKNVALDSAQATIAHLEDLAHTPWYKSLFGDGIIEAGTKLAGGAAACTHSGETCLGYVGSNAVDFVVAEVID